MRTDEPNTVVARSTACAFDGERKITASGVVRNVGEKPYQVSITSRFVDGDGVRVDLATDSVSDLEPGESARWEATIYSEDGDSVRRCEVSTRAS